MSNSSDGLGCAVVDEFLRVHVRVNVSAVNRHLLMFVATLVPSLHEATCDNNQQDRDGEAQDDCERNGS